ncbi:hypothetical protein BDN72DRAFT_892049 [Pluteus cervinus]|uniref:Uncharacterized protein n=1 Tax=Pluteus cervinus TaxID=181527 RepID=A0ACD3BCG7_9AGAR|nr:hypothetical protein BDN72DRAFT_892049 [Pluteus cervinus]
MTGLSRETVEGLVQVVLDSPAPPSNFVEDAKAIGASHHFVKNKPDIETFSFGRVIALLQQRLDPSFPMPEDPMVVAERLRPGFSIPNWEPVSDEIHDEGFDEPHGHLNDHATFWAFVIRKRNVVFCLLRVTVNPNPLSAQLGNRSSICRLSVDINSPADLRHHAPYITHSHFSRPSAQYPWFEVFFHFSK